MLSTHTIPPISPPSTPLATCCSIRPTTLLIVTSLPILSFHAVQTLLLFPYRINRVSSASAPAATGESFRCRRGAREGEQRSICLSLVRTGMGVGLTEDLVFGCVNVWRVGRQGQAQRCGHGCPHHTSPHHQPSTRKASKASKLPAALSCWLGWWRCRCKAGR